MRCHSAKRTPKQSQAPGGTSAQGGVATKQAAHHSICEGQRTKLGTDRAKQRFGGRRGAFCTKPAGHYVCAHPQRTPALRRQLLRVARSTRKSGRRFHLFGQSAQRRRNARGIGRKRMAGDAVGRAIDAVKHQLAPGRLRCVAQ